MSWFEESFVYQIYPLGCCGAPHEQDGELSHRLRRLASPAWIEHLRRLGVSCVLLNPVFDSSSHGYDTRDFAHVDPRLGDDDDLRALVAAYHEAGFHVLFDAVLNHVGRDFWAFRDVREKGRASAYADWFCIDWGRDDQYGDGFAYETWEGVPFLVKLNHANFDLNAYCADVVRAWARGFGADGLRLDVAYCLDLGFLAYLRQVADELGAERGEKFALVGECLHGDYNLWMNDHACDSVTNYEAYKGLWSSMNSANMHEIGYALERQSGNDPWDLYRGKHLLDFVDNHDVPRIATKLADKAQLVPLYGLLFAMCGVPSVYYGSEWGIEGDKGPGDYDLRPEVAEPSWTSLTDWVATLAKARAGSEAILWGGYRQLLCQPQQLVFERETADERVIVAVNAAPEPATLHFDARCGQASDLLTGEAHDFGGGSEVPAYSCRWWRCL